VVVAVIEEDGGDAGVALEDTGEFSAAIAAMSDNSSDDGVHWLFMRSYE
jgi:hypothetical protein